MPSSLPVPENDSAGQNQRLLSIHQPRPGRRPADAETSVLRESRVPAHVFLLAIIVFIVYGSLFPFNFTSQSLPIDHFYAEYNLFANRADLIDNFLLFVPLGIGLHASFRQPAARLLAAILSVLVLAIGIQLVQLYLPGRTASVADAFWNTVGMGTGFLVASRVRHAFVARLAVHASGCDSFLACLVVLWFFYESFPFIPTLDIGELRAHIKSAIFAPPFELMRLVQHGLAAALAGIAMMRLGWLRRPELGLMVLAAVSLVLEICVPYGSLRRETLFGIALGLVAGYVMAHRFRQRSHHIALGLAMCAYLITVLIPYRGQALDPGFTLTPFSHLLWRGILKDVSPSAFEALAIGTMLWAGTALNRFRQRPYAWSAIVLPLLAALEWVRVALLGYHGDTTTLVMASMLAPAVVALRAEAAGGMAQSLAPDHMPVPRATPATAPGGHSALALFAFSAAALTLAILVVLQLPGIPYNVKKLFGDHVFIGAGMFSLALLWLGSGPWGVIRVAIYLDERRRHGTMWVPMLLLGVALVSFAILNLGTPEIMLNKIIGAPDLYRLIVDENYLGDAWRIRLSAWPSTLVGAAERLVRYVALYSVFSIPLVVSLFAIAGRDRSPRVLLNIVYLLPFWLLAKYVVLDWAITDNLTELLADGGAVFLGALIVLFSINAVTLVAYAGRPRMYPALTVFTVALVVAAWYLLNQGIETVVINNDRIFSGVQFLLGENRTALLSTPALLVRWCVLYASGLTVVATGVLLSMRLLPLPKYHSRCAEPSHTAPSARAHSRE